MSKYFYTYIIESKRSQKYYYGRHQTESLDDGYMGTGTWVRQIKDKSRLRKTILNFYPNLEQLEQAEKELIGDKWLVDPFCMNMMPGGKSDASAVVSNSIWVNNGVNSRRLKPGERIPEGYVRGRIYVPRKVKMSKESREKISATKKAREQGKSILFCPHGCDGLFNHGNLAKHIRCYHE